MKKIYLMLMTVVTFFCFTQLVQANVYDILVCASVNSQVGTAAVQMDNSDELCTEVTIWEDSLTYDLIVYLGDSSDATVMYYTIAHGTKGVISFVVPDQLANGIYVKSTITAGVNVNFIGVIKKGY